MSYDCGKRLKRRLAVAALGLAAWSGLLCHRLVELQVVRGEHFRDLAERQRQGFIEISPQRGDILDRGLAELAVSVPVESVFAHPGQVADPDDAARRLAPILEADEEELRRKLSSRRPFVYLARKASPQQAERALDLGLEGVYSQPDSRRYYPSRELAAHVLGFVGADGRGLSGLEYRYEKQLKGRKARVDVKVDARRRLYYRDEAGAPTRGNDLVLTLDKKLQFIAEEVLAKTVESHQALSGSAVLMDPGTGAVLAMASHPPFNPNNHADFPAESYRNRAVRSIYEPGSTFKILTLASVLNEGLVEPGEEIDCSVGTVRLGRKVYREAGHKSFGLLDFDGIVAKSSNVGTIRLTLRLGEERLYEYLRRFGFGRETGVDLPGEESGILRPVERWSKLSIGALSIGQEIGATPLQMASAVSAVANGGLRVRPHLVDRILSPGGDVVWKFQSQRRRILSPGAAGRMKEALKVVVERGTGTGARLNGYSSAGKTGTAQKFIAGAYSKTRFVPSYAGFAPLAEPALAAVVVIDEPKGEHYASTVAAPAFREIMERSLIHLGVPKDAPEQDLGEKLRRRLSAESELRRGQRLYESGEDSQEPRGAWAAPRDLAPGTPDEAAGRVIDLQGESFQIPDFSGLSLREALGEASRLGLRLKAVGRGVAVNQRPAPGTPAKPDMLFEVYFSRREPDSDPHEARRTDLAGGAGHRD